MEVIKFNGSKETSRNEHLLKAQNSILNSLDVAQEIERAWRATGHQGSALFSLFEELLYAYSNNQKALEPQRQARL